MFGDAVEACFGATLARPRCRCTNARDSRPAARAGTTRTLVLTSRWSCRYSCRERLTAYHGEAEDLPQSVLQEFLDSVAAGRAVVPIGRIYAFDQIVEAPAAMEAGDAVGKLVVTT